MSKRVKPGKPAIATPRILRRDALIAAAVFAGVAALYARTAAFDYINMDDHLYVQGHEVVERGLSWEGVKYAFTSYSEGNYLPLTWLSHMITVEIGGTRPAAHHVANVLLHALGSALVFVFLRSATGATGRSVTVALLFAVHPLRVESVAWVAERKDVLSGMTGILCLIAYVWYARTPRLGRYLLMAGLFALGLLSKSMLVTLPFVMLLLDFWPLGRLHKGRWRAVVAEKLPLFGLSMLCAVVTVLAQRTTGAMGTLEAVPVVWRLWNTPAAYGVYLYQTVWPLKLGVMYPYLDYNTVVFRGLCGMAAIGLVSVPVLLRWRKQPYLAVGWLWFLGTLVPVIGLLQVGAQAHADRYTYFPHIGLLMGAVWALSNVLEGRPQAARISGAAAAALILVLSGLTWRQVGFWRNSETLLAHTLSVTRENPIAEGNYAGALMVRGEFQVAEQHLRRILAMGKAKARDYHNLGIALMSQGRLPEAQGFLEMAVSANPASGLSWALLGNVRLKRGQGQGAVEAFQKALAHGFEQWIVRVNLALALGMAERPEEAAAAFETLLAERPEDSAALFNYGLMFVGQFKFNEAAQQLERGLSGDPENAGMLYYLGVCRVWQSRLPDSLTLLRRAASKDPMYRKKAAQDQLWGPLGKDPEFQKFLRER